MAVEVVVSGKWKENGYIVSSSGGDAVVIDPGGSFDEIDGYIMSNRLRVHAVLNTHAHFDHLGAVASTVAAHNAPFHLHPGDADLLRRANFYGTMFMGEEPITVPHVDIELKDAMTLQFGTLELDVVHTPGHTPGSVCFVVGGELFTGDTVMAEHLGRTDLPGGDRAVLSSSLRLLADRYPPDTQLHPGHGKPALLGDVLSRLGALPELR